MATIAHAKLVFGDLEGTKADMDAAWQVLDTLEGVDSGVNAAYYGVAADYYKVSSWFSGLFFMTQYFFVLQAKAEYAPYYRHSLLYLACVDLEKEMSAEEKLIRAHDLAISAFLADTIHNFGELVLRSCTSLWKRSRVDYTVDAPNLGRFQRNAS